MRVRVVHSLMPSIRAFRPDDIDEVARLHQESFPPDTGPAPLEAYRTYFRDTFFRGPYANAGFPSLVCEDSNGSLSGFLGVVPVRMMLAGGRSIWATLCTQFCVEPQRRGMTGLRLLRAHLGGPQDLSISDEANTTTMRLWTWAGGEAVTSSSLHFVRPLRPACLALSRIELRTGFGFVTRRFALPARLLDRALARVPRTHVRPREVATTGEPLDLATMASELPALLMPENGRERRLVPHYEPAALAWSLVRAQLADGKIVGVRVRAPDGKLLGWYVYLREPDDTALLLQLAAPADAAPAVLDRCCSSSPPPPMRRPPCSITCFTKPGWPASPR
jgi:hypothetical protein